MKKVYVRLPNAPSVRYIKLFSLPDLLLVNLDYQETIQGLSELFLLDDPVPTKIRERLLSLCGLISVEPLPGCRADRSDIF